MFTISTKRLQLRRIKLADADFMLELLNSPEWLKYIGDRNINSTAEAQAYIKAKVLPAYEKFGFGFYLVESREARIRLGICGLIRRAGLEDADIGFALLPPYTGQGFALEAARATLEYGFKVHALERIVAITACNNKKSIGLLKNLGMIHEKMIKLPDDDEELMLFISSSTQHHIS